MTPQESFEPPAPRPEELAAYVDGELDSARCEAIEAWLAAHPERWTEVDALRRLMRLYQETQPAEPSAAAWENACSQVHARLEGSPVPSDLPTGRTRRPVRLALVAAAALVGFWLLARSWWIAPGHLEEEDDEPYPVASAEEITVISMETRDTGGLVVGQPPISDNYEFASLADVTVVRLEGAVDDQRPPEMVQGEVPMVVAPDVASHRPD